MLVTDKMKGMDFELGPGIGLSVAFQAFFNFLKNNIRKISISASPFSLPLVCESGGQNLPLPPLGHVIPAV